MTDKQAEALELADELLKPRGFVQPGSRERRAAAELRRLHARNQLAQLTTQLEAIGAGGVESLRKK